VNDVFWINGKDPPYLAVVLRPRGEDWLEDDLRRLKRCGIETIVSLLQLEEARWLGLEEEGPLAEKVGIEFLSHPIPDTHVPSSSTAFHTFAAGLADRLRTGEHIGVHCRGSIGRATITAACTLIHLGWDSEVALDAVEVARGCPVPDTAEQKAWILRYEVRS
jgi:protein-tyrosine phosphatase